MFKLMDKKIFICLHLENCYFFQAAPNVTIAQTNSAQPLQTAAAQVPALAGMQQVVFLNPTQLATALQPQLLFQAPAGGLVGVE